RSPPESAQPSSVFVTPTPVLRQEVFQVTQALANPPVRRAGARRRRRQRRGVAAPRVRVHPGFVETALDGGNAMEGLRAGQPPAREIVGEPRDLRDCPLFLHLLAPEPATAHGVLDERCLVR